MMSDETPKPCCSTPECDAGVLYACGLCQKCYKQANYRRNRDKAIARAKAHRDANPEAKRATDAAYCRANKEKLAAYRAANSDKRAAQAKEWRERNPEYYPARRVTHPAEMRAAKQNRRSREANAEGSVTPKQLADLVAQYGRLCPRCGVESPLSIDHIIPLSKGGTNNIDNLQPLCRPCNSSKGNRHTTKYPPRHPSA